MSPPDPRREDWRVQRFHDEIAEERTARLRAKKMRHAVWFGVALGLIGSFAFYV